jgi:ACS family hexuronate transporter-like MFS transporter
MNSLQPNAPVIDDLHPGLQRKSPGHYRWVICALLFLATTINYMDRQVIGLLAGKLKHQFGWDDQHKQYANIVLCFSIAYALGQLVSGPIINRLGTKIGYSLSLIVWSLAAVGHGFMRSFGGFATMRFLLGLGEAGNFPAAIKTVAEWFPKRERALATGIFNAGSNIGAIVAPMTVPWIAIHWGWPWAFYITGAFGFLWLALWLPLYQSPAAHPRLSPAELAFIQSDPADAPGKIPWLSLLSHRQTWAFIVGKFLPDAVWWFYLYWAPTFLDEHFHLSLSKIGLPLVVIYVTADIGSIGGGWLSSFMIKSGFSINLSRKIPMLLCALCILPVAYAPLATHAWTAVGLIALAAGAHQGWSANVYTLSSDMFPRQAVASVAGIGGMAGAVGGIVLTLFVGDVLKLTSGNYVPIFIVCGATYLSALLFIQLLAPRLEQAKLQ